VRAMTKVHYDFLLFESGFACIKGGFLKKGKLARKLHVGAVGPYPGHGEPVAGKSDIENPPMRVLGE